MIPVIQRAAVYWRIRAMMPERKNHISGIANQGFPGMTMLFMWYLDKEIVAKTAWWGYAIAYNYRLFGVVDPHYLETITLDHELVHCMLLQWELGVAYKDPYYYRFHEAMAYHFSGPKTFRTFLDVLEEENPNGPRDIFRYALLAKKMGKPTGPAKDYACEQVTGMDWRTFREAYIIKAEAPYTNIYPKDKLPETAMRYEDYKQWKEKQEKEKKEAEEKAEKTEKETP